MTMEEWGQLLPPWREAFELAWESFRAGSPGIGAVVVDADGRIVSRGRSRRGESMAPGGQVAASYLAHAEINALIGPDQRRRPDHTLYTTLESCFVCAAAAAMSHIGTVRFAGSDPIWRFLQDLPGAHPELAVRWPTVEGPLPGPIGAFASLLGIADLVVRSPDGRALSVFRESLPDLVELALGLMNEGELDGWRTRDLDEVVGSLWPQLAERV